MLRRETVRGEGRRGEVDGLPLLGKNSISEK
jgi:hypothetical protein